MKADTAPSVTLLHVMFFPVLKNGVGFITLPTGMCWPWRVSSVGREAPGKCVPRVEESLTEMFFSRKWLWNKPVSSVRGKGQ